MKITIVGHLAQGQNLNDGQTVKTRNLYEQLKKMYHESVFYVDTYNYKAHPFKLFGDCMNAIKTSNYIIILPAMNGIKFFVPLFTCLNKKYHCKLIYAVVGGWLPEFIENKKFLLKSLMRLDKIFVETSTMQEKLNKIGVRNVEVLVNFKDIKPINKKELKSTIPNIYKVCTFSRVIKEKGIENAIKVVEEINKKYNKQIFCLDIYGPIAEEYKEEFQELIRNADSSYIQYKGVVDSKESVKKIKQYDLLLFPTYYQGEGLAGTIIDSFFAGVPVVASNWRYNTDVIKDKETGFIFETKDDEAMKRTLEDIYHGKYDLKKMQLNCLEQANQYLPEIAIKPLINYINDNKKTKRLLCIVSSMDRGGAETFLMKLYRELDKERYQLDFCVSKEQEGFYDEEIRKLGGKIYIIPQKSKQPIKSFFSLKKLVKENRYQFVLRTSQQALATLDLIAAKLGGAKKLIYRSSNAGLVKGRGNQLLNKIFSFLPRVVPNVKIAPSTEAAIFVFGKKAVNEGEVKLLHNGLDYDKFRFRQEIRNKIREELRAGDKKIYGHVGRFNEQKNHMFLLEIFRFIHQKDNNSVLVLIGEGELKEEIEKNIEKLNLTSNILMLGTKDNINEYLMAMDTLLFPSFFEGMPNVVIEAQATGLPCVLSNTITKEAAITDLLSYIDLNESAQVWGEIAMKKSFADRKDYEEEFQKKGYIMKDIVEEYIECLF